jgi:radical SAM protein with 4Fe4S-binding SPASM domain
MAMNIGFFSFLIHPKSSFPSSGLHFYDINQQGYSGRAHLRVEQDGSSVLVINAARILYLNPTATLMAHSILNGLPQQSILYNLHKKFHVSGKVLKSDLDTFSRQLTELLDPDGSCPIHDLDLETIPPFQTIPSAPYRMDLALTYRCNNDCYHCYNDRPRDFPELTTAQWYQMLDRVWEIGIPHVVFTGGEPTLRSDLAELIAYAENKGLITGLNTNGRRLNDNRYLAHLVENGLDHVQITLESHLPEIHDEMVHSRGAWKQTIQGIQNALASDLYVMTNTTMLVNNHSQLSGTLDFLAGLGVPTVGLNALIYSGKGRSVGTGLSEKDLLPLLEMAKEKTKANDQRLIWYTPTHYCNFDPVLLDLGIKGCTAALYNMCIEPDGGVLPCQSYYQHLGNLLVDNWKDIWNHDLAMNLRNRRYLPQKCQGCALQMECGGGCPLAEFDLPVGIDAVGDLT